MSSRRRSEQCRICGGVLQGNQRRWLFSGNKKNQNQSQSLTPSGSVRGPSQSQSNCSSPWGSTLSLGSSVSLRSQLSANISKSFDLLSILTHILGCSVSRGNSEFICGKCVSVLERVFKYDTVIARVRALSSERLQRLTQERDKIRQWVRNSYIEKNPHEIPIRTSSTSEEEGESEKDGYREMLRDNMALSEYEFWSEKWDTCPFFIRSGKRCRKGKGCEGCNALRVSDSDYESVCGVPRNLPFYAFSPLAFSRDKSQSMPLNLQKTPSVTCSSPASLAGSTVSLPSRTESIQSLDSLDDKDPFVSPQHVTVKLLLKEISDIQGNAVNSPAGSRIPILERRGRVGRGYSGERKKMVLNRVLDFENGEEEEEEDAIMELGDEFVPLHGQNSVGRPHQVVKLLRAQLDQARTRIKTLEDQVQNQVQDQVQDGTKPEALNGSTDWNTLDGDFGVQSLNLSLRSRERLLQESMAVIRRLCLEEGKGPELSDKLTEKLSESLKETTSQTRDALARLEREVLGEKQRLEQELESLRKCSTDRERDLDTLQIVLQANQELIQELRVSLGEKEQQLKALYSEREVSAQRERALNAALGDKDSLLLCLQQELDTCHKDVQALSDTVLADLSSGDKTGALVSRLKEKQAELAAVIEEREENSTTMCQEVTKLTSALQEYQSLVQLQQESHSQVLSSLTNQLSKVRTQLREREKERRERAREWGREREEDMRQKSRLMKSLEKRDQLIEQILHDAEEQERLFRELRQNLQNKFHLTTGIKHTL
ncbi:myosin-11 [Periophthalmus magnuspinnatus]|uniref:myosin-11 n=1 Tax=Periophthalmus magnuspinnatus TaxID=409849 RepID=UPI002436B1B2|nr:myosin-11 [Periophthalmus magnuspinnatus]